jgi:hypothetical protein
MVNLPQLLNIQTGFRVSAMTMAKLILNALQKHDIFNFDLLCSQLEQNSDDQIQMEDVMSFIDHFTMERLMKLAQCEFQSRDVISFMLEVKFDYVKHLDVVNAYCFDKNITDENEKERIYSEFYQSEINRLDAKIHYQLGNSRTALDRLNLLKLSLEKHYLNKIFLQEKVSSNKTFLKGLRKKMNEALKKLNRLKTLITSSPEKSEIVFLEKEVKRLEKILSELSSANFTSIIIEKKHVLYLNYQNLLKKLIDEMKIVSCANGISFRQFSIIFRMVKIHGFKQSFVFTVIEMFGWDKFESLSKSCSEKVNDFLIFAGHNFSFGNYDWLVSVVVEELTAKLHESQSRLNELLGTISAQDLQELRELERMIPEQETVFSELKTEYSRFRFSKMSEENSLYSRSKTELNQLKWLVPSYTIAFLKNPDLENMNIRDVIQYFRKKEFSLPVAPEPTVCNHSCSVEDLISAIVWLSSGLDGMFKKLDPSLFIFLLTSTFDSHKCGYFNVFEKLFKQVIMSNVRNGGIVGSQADCGAHVCHDRNGCLPCLCAKTITSFLKYGPNCVTVRDPESSFKKTGLHCSVNDGAIKSLLVSMSTLDSYGLFCFILYLCQQMDYFNSNIARDRKVEIDHKKIADVKYLIALLVQHHLPTNPCLSVLVERYNIPTIVSNPIPVSEIARAFSVRSAITIEDASERILAINREYFSPENVAGRLKSTKDRLTSWCKSDAQHMSRHGHGLQEPCPPGCWCCG